MNIEEYAKTTTASAVKLVFPIILSATPLFTATLDRKLTYQGPVSHKEEWEQFPQPTASVHVVTLSDDQALLLEAMASMAQTLIAESKNLDPDIARIVNESFDEML